MNQAISDLGTQDKATLRKLGIAVFCMCIGALGLVVLAVTVGHHFH